MLADGTWAAYRARHQGAYPQLQARLKAAMDPTIIGVAHAKNASDPCVSLSDMQTWPATAVFEVAATMQFTWRRVQGLTI